MSNQPSNDTTPKAVPKMSPEQVRASQQAKMAHDSTAMLRGLNKFRARLSQQTEPKG